MLIQNVDKLYLLGEPADLTIIQIISVGLQYERMWSRAQNGAEAFWSIDANTEANKFRPHLELLQRLLQQGDRELEPFDVKP